MHQNSDNSVKSEDVLELYCRNMDIDIQNRIYTTTRNISTFKSSKVTGMWFQLFSSMHSSPDHWKTIHCSMCIWNWIPWVVQIAKMLNQTFVLDGIDLLCKACFLSHIRGVGRTGSYILYLIFLLWWNGTNQSNYEL